MMDYEIKHMIIDEQYDEEHVTANFTFNNQEYSVTFQKSDLEIINAWRLEENTSLPANLSGELIDTLRKDVKKSI
ncbi:hypothetical protein DS745_23275 [Anaerobacillus alkaliphilus]|uniref:Uncharacterized protein n=1 Tax=Anaerobacillus alkaliphilus TaxID=1548597 RepID=A0A4Q0VQI6_9BACI|nr:hypothetical protein [Anaerobacillus alkaliphilus]RXI96625.1 hypothetical protein DS745_23275 [Anaerobacillus alkaliphilus]